MPVVVQVCVVIATIAIVIVAIMAVRLMQRLEMLSAAAIRSLGGFDTFLEQSQQASVRIYGMLASFEQITDSIRSTVSKLEGVVDRAAGLSSSILDEVERPIQKAVAVLRGLQAGAAFLVEKWTSRPSAPRDPVGDSDV